MDITECIKFISDLIKRSSQDHISRLPSVRVLALQSGVSPVVMLRVLKHPSFQDELVIKRGSGIYLSNNLYRDKKTVIPGGNTLSGRITGKIRSDLLRGMYPPQSTLPSFKELSLVYGASFRTLQKSLIALEKESLIIRRGRTYQTVPINSRGKRGTVILVCRGESNGRLIFWVPRMQSTLHLLETECNRAGINLEKVACDFYGSLNRRGSGQFSLEQFIKDTQVLGLIIWTPGIYPPAMRSLSSRIDKLDLPYAVLSETTDDYPISNRLSGFVKEFTMAISSEAGQIVARSLYAHGHRRVGIITPYEKDRWSDNRISGIKDTYAQIGADTSVVVSSRFFPEQSTPLDTNHVNEIVRSTIGKIQSNVPWKFNIDDLSRDMAPTMQSFVMKDYLRTCISGQIDEILSKDSVSAIIGINDETALLVLDGLRKRSLSVPKDISLVGFDDTIEACMENLTSYNFNQQAVVRAILSHLLDRKGARSSKSAIEIEGFVVERGSLGRVEPDQKEM